MEAYVARGAPTGASAEPLNSRFLDDGEPPEVCRYAEETYGASRLRPCTRGNKAALRVRCDWGTSCHRSPRSPPSERRLLGNAP
jgi:hypothetical protein